jgi:hypothetical protein
MRTAHGVVAGQAEFQDFICIVFKVRELPGDELADEILLYL